MSYTSHIKRRADETEYRKNFFFFFCKSYNGSLTLEKYFYSSKCEKEMDFILHAVNVKQ